MGTTISGIDTTRVLDPNLNRTPTNELGKDAFLQLLVTQLSNQNPLEPTSDTEFISQMANFSSLEQMQNLNGSMQTMTANSLIGQRVCSSIVADGDGNRSQKDVCGQVTGTLKIDGEEYLQVLADNSDQVYLVPLNVITNVDAGGNADMQTLLTQILASLNQIQTNQASAAAASTYGIAPTATDYGNTYFGGG
ncbi:MAG: flagellar hook capping FlgD N-terminal domain-containing protein [Clostridia bacterium]|nr:flagellar hook capping FlgD N-terminal domain-containing protein [Clostridia bacterium]